MEEYMTRLSVDTAQIIDVTEDFELPEYQAEMRRVVGVQCGVTRDQAFLDGGEAEVAGCVTYTVVYMSGTGGLASVPLYTQWKTKIPLPERFPERLSDRLPDRQTDGADGVNADGGGIGVEDLFITCEGESASCRVTGPRKCTLSARVKVRCAAVGRTECPSPAGTADQTAGDLTCRTEDTPVVRLKTCRRTGTVEGSLFTDGDRTPPERDSRIPDGDKTAARNFESSPPETENSPAENPVPKAPQIITCGGNVTVNDVQRTADGLAVQGEAVVQMLVLTPAGTYASLRSRAEIRDTIPCGAAREGFREEAAALGRCASLSVNADETGEIRWEMEYDLEGILLGSGTSCRAVDGYSSRYEDTPQMESADSLTGSRWIRSRISIDGEKPLRIGDRSGSDGDLRFLYGWGRGTFEKAERLPGTASGIMSGSMPGSMPSSRILLTGTAHCTVLLSGGGDVVQEEAAIPIRMEWDGGAYTEEDLPDCRCCFTVWDVTGRVDGSSLHLHAEVGCEGILFHRRRLVWLRGLIRHEDRPLRCMGPAAVVYIPAAGEGVWDVQKRYRTGDVTEDRGRFVVRL